MRLTTLTLHGFKSFADRTTLELLPGVNAVIGPNGAGKSNLVEALRWALGGGRASAFRAEDKRELIFHGAAGKRGVNYAEVELELNTSGRRLIVSRSLLRDGQPTLRLNGRPARLADLEEALAGSGLGRGGLAIIGQGEISQVLLADPARLLGYVAEAAGVALLSSRRDQTIARLTATEAHLARLADLQQGLASQLEALRQEAEQAALAEVLRHEHLQLRYSLAVRRAQHAEAEIAALMAQQAALEAELSAAAKQRQAMQERWSAVRQATAEREAAYRQALAEAEARKGDYRVAVTRLEAARARLDDLARRQAQLEAELAEPAEAPPLPPDGDDAALQAECDAAREQAEALALEAARLEKQLDKARQALEHRRRVALEAAAQVGRRAELVRRIEELTQRLALLQAEAEDDGAALTQQLAAYQAELDAVVQQLAEQQHELLAAHQAHAASEAQAAALAQAAARARSQLQARQGYALGPKNALTSGVPGVVGSVADLIEVPRAYRRAIAGALGRRAEYVVVDSAGAAERVLEVVKAQGGWVTLLPLDLLTSPKRPRVAHLESADGVLGWASDLVDVESRFRPMVDQLLGQTLVVKSLAQALALARRHRVRPRLVTLDGDVLEAYGALSGGRRGDDNGLIGAAAEAAEAEAQAAQAAALAAEQLAALQEKQRAVNALRERREALRAMIAPVERKLEHLHDQATIRATRLAALTEQEAMLRQELAALGEPATPPDDGGRLERDVSELARRLSEVRAQAEQALARQAEASQALMRHQHDVQRYHDALYRYKQHQARRAALQQRLAELLGEIGGARQQQAEAERDVMRAKEALPHDVDAKKTAFHQAQEELAEVEAALSELGQQQAQRAEQLEGVRLSRARREAVLEGLQAELMAFPSGLTPCEGGLKALRGRLGEVETELERIGPVNHRAELSYRQLAARAQTLADEIADTRGAVEELQAVVTDIEREVARRLDSAVRRVRARYQEFVAQLFGGGEGEIEVLRENGHAVGLRLSLQPPGKATRALGLLSVGERTMGALAFLFALMSQSGDGVGLPIAILDEVDAPLDEANIRRFCRFVAELSGQGTQFVLITHQKATMEIADALWGVTSEQGVSRVFSIGRH